MNIIYNKEYLVAFEEEIVKLFYDKKILAPIHLYSENEEQMITIFKDYVDEGDWIMCSWRSHFQCLLRGVPPEDVKQAIIEGKSISLCFPKYKVISSAIVGGILPIAVGVAMGIKRKNGKNKVVCFLGETTAETGAFYECLKYSINHQLNVLFVIEDNGFSVCTPTRHVWNTSLLTYEPRHYKEKEVMKVNDKALYYKYQNKYPHAGGLQRVNF